MGPTWGRQDVGPTLAPWTLLPGSLLSWEPNLLVICTVCPHKIHTWFCCVFFVVVILLIHSRSMWCICPYSSGLLHRHWGNHMIAPVQVKQPCRMQVQSYQIWQQQSNTKWREKLFSTYCQSFNVSGNEIDHSDVVGALPVRAAPTTSSFLT